MLVAISALWPENFPYVTNVTDELATRSEICIIHLEKQTKGIQTNRARSFDRNQQNTRLILSTERYSSCNSPCAQSLSNQTSYVMKSNLGTIDKISRVLVFSAAVLLYFLEVTSGALGIALIAIGAVLLLTSLINYCPIYAILGISTKRKK